MKISFYKKATLLFLVISLVAYELFAFTVFGKTISGLGLGKEYLLYIFIANCIFLLIYGMFLVRGGAIDKNEKYKIILPSLTNIGCYAFLFFSPNFEFGQIVIILSLLFNHIFLNNIEGNKRVSLVNIISFFTVFLFYFFAYSAITYLLLPYWTMVSIVIIFSILILYYKLKSVGMAEKYIGAFIVTFAIIVAEFFLLLFFAPLKSVFIKSLLLVLVYYFYWGMLDLYVRELFKKKKVFIFFVVFSMLTILLFCYAFFSGGLK